MKNIAYDEKDTTIEYYIMDILMDILIAVEKIKLAERIDGKARKGSSFCYFKSCITQPYYPS